MMTAELDVRITKMIGWPIGASYPIPPFSTSLDACMEWLVPFMAEQGWKRWKMWNDSAGNTYWEWWDDIDNVIRGDIIPATAACEAALTAIGSKTNAQT